MKISFLINLRILQLFLVSIFLALSMIDVRSSSSSENCNDDSDCGELSICEKPGKIYSKECTDVECTNDSHCGDRQICEQGMRLVRYDYYRRDFMCAPKRCKSQRDCEDPDICQRHTDARLRCVRTDCTSDSDCKADQLCKNKFCANRCPIGKDWVTTMASPARTLCADALDINLEGCKIDKSGAVSGCSEGKECAKSVEGKYFCVSPEESSPTHKKEGTEQ